MEGFPESAKIRRVGNWGALNPYVCILMIKMGLVSLIRFHHFQSKIVQMNFAIFFM